MTKRNAVAQESTIFFFYIAFSCLCASLSLPPFLSLIHLLAYKADGFTFNTLITIRINNNNILQQSRVDRKDAHATREYMQCPSVRVFLVGFLASPPYSVTMFYCWWISVYFMRFSSSPDQCVSVTRLYPGSSAKPMPNPRYEFQYKCFLSKTIFLNRILL